MINPEDVRNGVTKQCADSGHDCNGLMCGCYCHDQDQARWRDQMRSASPPGTPTPAQLPPALTGKDVVNRLFGPAEHGGNLEAAKAEAERVLGEHERQVREQVAREIASISFPVAAGTYSEVLVASQAVNRALAEVQVIVRGGPGATAQLQYWVPGVEVTAEHLHALDRFRQSRGMLPWYASAPPGVLPSFADINRAVTWWNNGGHRGN